MKLHLISILIKFQNGNIKQKTGICNWIIDIFFFIDELPINKIIQKNYFFVWFNLLVKRVNLTLSIVTRVNSSGGLLPNLWHQLPCVVAADINKTLVLRNNTVPWFHEHPTDNLDLTQYCKKEWIKCFLKNNRPYVCCICVTQWYKG